MKPNEAPEKIYISTNSQDGTYYISNQYKRLIEYTRTDAFVEKARKWFEEHADDYNYTWYNEMEGESGITIECIKDFINYMEGE